jgi:hypothetical protein
MVDINNNQPLSNVYENGSVSISALSEPNNPETPTTSTPTSSNNIESQITTIATEPETQTITKGHVVY